MIFVAYYRVSTARQGLSGLGLDAQRSAVAQHVAGRGELVAQFTEIESGRKDDRPQLDAALDLCRRKKAVLVIAKLDRLARDVAFIANLMKSGIEFVATDMPDANRLTLHVMAAFAEHEREAISKRTRDALVAAKARGVRLGNPRPDMKAMTEKASNRAAAFRASVLPLVQSLHARGWTLQRVADDLNIRNMPTLNGRKWAPATVRGVLARADGT